jgi:ABC-2 type transport system ATP-binding protein
MNVISARNLSKSFRGGITAVAGIDLEIAAGTIFGFLGPNGAGKTTTIRMLATLLPLGGGEATVAGHDVRRASREVRRCIGYVSQLGGADRLTTPREDLRLQGELYGMSDAEARQRTAELIETLEMADFADRRVSTLSGGQKRRLNVALGIVHRPDVLFLDEPTVGLDPQNRINLWTQIRRLRDTGTTVFLTTHYLEEADVLSDRLAIMDHGRIVADGTAARLKEEISGDCIVLSFPEEGVDIGAAVDLFRRQPYVREVVTEADHVRLYVREGPVVLPELFRLLDQRHITVRTATLSEPTLDDVFLRQTGRSLRDAGPDSAEGSAS